MALDLVYLLSHTLVNWNFAILILGGFLAAAWLLVRLAGVSSDDISEYVNKLALIGFPVGITALITVGAGLYLISKNLEVLETYDIITMGLLGILGLVLVLRPIKDFKFGVFISLAIGLFGAGLLVFFGASSVKLLAVVFVLLFFVIYGATRLFEDLYLLIAEILSSPLISVIIGILCVLQGILEVLGFSLWMIFSFLLGG
ncbi:MAG: hypothetical protein ACFE9L_00880 [Candidatus Hodarchaeota archaeon]